MLSLYNPDFLTATRVIDAINARFAAPVANATDPGTIEIQVPDKFIGNTVPLMASLSEIEVTPDTKARVVINERTGTVVMGENVRISTLAIAHGNLSIVVRENTDVSQPLPLSQGQTVATPNTDINIQEPANKLMVVPKGINIGEVSQCPQRPWRHPTRFDRHFSGHQSSRCAASGSGGDLMADIKPMGVDSALFQMHAAGSDRTMNNIKAGRPTDKAGNEALETVSRQFESLLLNMMIKEMRATVPESGLFPASMSKDIFTSMLDEQYADRMAESGGIGLKRMLMDQLAEMEEEK